MNIIFIGGVTYSYEILSSILNAGWNISAVFSYMDSKKNKYSDFANFDELAKKFEFKNIKVNNINDFENIEIIKEIKPDLILVMGWSQLLKKEIISIPRIGIIGSHPTELPKYRGRAPIPWTILKNLKKSALTFFWINEGVDNGDILDQVTFDVNQQDDASTIYQKVIKLGKEMILSDLEKINEDNYSRKKQNPEEFIENWPKRTPEDGKIDWTISGKEIQTLIRATTHPYPGAYTFLNNSKLIIWKADFIKNGNFDSGKILEIKDNFINIGCKDGYLILKDVSLDEKHLSINKIFNQKDLGKSLG